MCFKLRKEIPCVWKVSHLKFKFYFVANRNWWIKLFSSIYIIHTSPSLANVYKCLFRLICMAAWAGWGGQESEVLCTCVLRIGRGVIPVCAWPGGGQWAGRGRGKSISCSQECVIGIQMDLTLSCCSVLLWNGELLLSRSLWALDSILQSSITVLDILHYYACRVLMALVTAYLE